VCPFGGAVRSRRLLSEGGTPCPTRHSCAPTAYPLRRDKVKAENPGASFGELNKIMGEKWKTISDERKAKYVEQAAELKKEFDAKEGKAPKASPSKKAKKEAEEEEEEEKEEAGGDEDEADGKEGDDDEDAEEEEEDENEEEE